MLILDLVWVSLSVEEENSGGNPRISLVYFEHRPSTKCKTRSVAFTTNLSIPDALFFFPLFALHFSTFWGTCSFRCLFSNDFRESCLIVMTLSQDEWHQGWISYFQLYNLTDNEAESWFRLPGSWGWARLKHIQGGPFSLWATFCRRISVRRIIVGVIMRLPNM